MKKLTTPIVILLALSAILISGYRYVKPDIAPIYIVSSDSLMSKYNGTIEVQNIINNYQSQLNILVDSIETYQASKGNDTEKLAEDPVYLHLQQDLETILKKMSNEAEYYAVWISDRIHRGITEYASVNNIDYIFSSGSNSSVQYVSPRYDISSQVLTYLNDQYQNEDN